MLDPSAGLRRQSLPKSRQIGGWNGPGCCGGFHSLQIFGHEFPRSPGHGAFAVSSEKMVLETKPETKFSGAPQTGILRISKTTVFFS